MENLHQSADKTVKPGSSQLLLSDAQCAVLLGISVRKFHELRQQEWMPLPIALGPRLLRWSRAELEDAVPKMPKAPRHGAEPAQLLLARRIKGGAPGFNDVPKTTGRR